MKLGLNAKFADTEGKIALSFFNLASALNGRVGKTYCCAIVHALQRPDMSTIHLFHRSANLHMSPCTDACCQSFQCLDVVQAPAEFLVKAQEKDFDSKRSIEFNEVSAMVMLT